MAAGEGSDEPDTDERGPTYTGGTLSRPATTDGDLCQDEEDGEDDEEEEPRLKYAPLTQILSSLYRNGDATSTFLVAGDKLVGRSSVSSRPRTMC